MKTKKLAKLLLPVVTLTCILASCSVSGSRYDSLNHYVPLMSPGDSLDYEYDSVMENDFSDPAISPNSTFSLDRNTSSYSYARRILTAGQKVAEDSVRIEEFVNYFSYDYPLPEAGEGLATTAYLADCPWNADSKLFSVGVSAEELSFENRLQNNLVFLLDVSGSMYGDDRLGLVQQAFTMLTEELADADRVSIVTYASGTRVCLEGALGSEKVRISNVLQDLEAGGSTFGQGGIQLAYQTAQKYFIEGGNNRVLLATDGDFNVGISSQDGLKKFISEQRDKGIYLSVLGVGMGNTKDTTMKTLAENGNGNYAYLDSVAEARKVLVEEMGGTLVTVAKDAKINIRFSEEFVEKYRLIGYETKMMSQEEFEDENKDAGEIGAGHTVTAVYEVQLKDGANGNFAEAELRFKDPSTSENKSITMTCPTSLYEAEANEELTFIGCVTEFGLLLRQSKYMGSANFGSVADRLRTLPSVVGANKNPFRAEFLSLVEKAQSIYA